MKKHYSVQYETGDIVFTGIGAALFGQISTAA
ncbi:YebB family permuted papain-like enzyme, partial [Salmonella enterica subsp. enterica serovar Infantis]